MVVLDVVVVGDDFVRSMSDNGCFRDASVGGLSCVEVMLGKSPNRRDCRGKMW